MLLYTIVQHGVLYFNIKMFYIGPIKIFFRISFNQQAVYRETFSGRRHIVIHRQELQIQVAGHKKRHFRNVRL